MGAIIKQSILTLAIAFMAPNNPTFAQKLAPLPHIGEDWSQPYQPFRIAGNMFYVGTHELASYLIVAIEGNVLINSGLAESAVQIRKNIEALGFHFNDIKILLTNQVHYDHVAAFAAIKAITGAKVYVNEFDAQVLADGGNSDYLMGGKGPLFRGVKADRLLHDGDTITLGPIKIIAMHHPGHTKGSTSFFVEMQDYNKSYKVLIANMPSVITDNITHLKSYPNIVQDYAKTFAVMKELKFDLWLAAHASQFNMHEKYNTGDGYRPEVFRDKKGFDEALLLLEKDYLSKLEKKK